MPSDSAATPKLVVVKMATRKCRVVEGGKRCDKPVRASHMCSAHYQRARQGAELTMIAVEGAADE